MAATAEPPPPSPSAVQRQTLLVLVAAQVLGGAGFFLGIAVIALLARDVSGSEGLSGLPPALGIAASALAAAPVSRWMDRAGRRPGLVAGHLCGAAGSIVVVSAGAADSFALLCVGAAAFGVGNTSNLLSRYAAADLSPPEARARAMGTVLFATTLGAVAGPNLASATAPLGEGFGVPALAAPFAVGAFFYVLAASILAAFLRPDPLLVSRAARDEAPPAPTTGAFTLEATYSSWPRPALIALAALVAVNVAMIAIMTMTPLHLDHAGHSLRIVGVVISLHVAAMFVPSPASGWLTDRVGRLPVIGVAGALLLAAGALAGLSSGHSAFAVGTALVLLGLAWNLGLVSASALLTESIEPARRARAQGTADLTMGLLGALASVSSGAILGLGGFTALAAIGAAAGLALAGLVLAAGRLSAPLPSAESS